MTMTESSKTTAPGRANSWRTLSILSTGAIAIGLMWFAAFSESDACIDFIDSYGDCTPDVYAGFATIAIVVLVIVSSALGRSRRGLTPRRTALMLALIAVIFAMALALTEFFWILYVWLNVRG